MKSVEDWKTRKAHIERFGSREEASDKEHWDYTLGGFREGVRYQLKIHKELKIIAGLYTVATVILLTVAICKGWL